MELSMKVAQLERENCNLWELLNLRVDGRVSDFEIEDATDGYFYGKLYICHDFPDELLCNALLCIASELVEDEYWQDMIRSELKEE